ncbi:MAG TPA: 30S ribosome-binding factor RbfA [Candidatus Cybelea sp.]|nr:30S ribosome-binding factor RbfA [Candidatus Cybelea sp.]
MARDRSSPRPSGQRPLRVGEEIRHALAAVLGRGDIRDPDLANVSITVSEVRVSPDLKSATAFVLPLGGRNADAVLAALGRCAPYLRGQIARAVRLRYAPHLAFKLDDSFDRAGRIDALLREPRVAADVEHGAERKAGADDQGDDVP